MDHDEQTPLVRHEAAHDLIKSPQHYRIMEEDIQYPEAAAAAAAASSNGGKKEEDGTIDVLLKMMNEDREKTDILDEGGLDQL